MTHERLPLTGSLLTLGLVLSSLALPTTASAQSLGVCNSFYSSGFSLSEGKVNPPQAAMSKPAKGNVFKEPNFGTCMVRGTDHANEQPSTFARNDYSRRQAFNADSSRFIVYSNDGWWHLYNANTLQHISRLSPRAVNPSTPAQYHMAGDAEPQWHPTDPNSLYYLPTNGGTTLLKLDVRDNSYEVAANFSGKLPSWGSAARHIWTKSEGSPSADGRYWGFQVEDANFRLLGYMVWDLQENRLAGSMQSSSRPDHSSMSASGRWFVPSSDSTGTWAWSRDFKTKKKLLHKSEHSDLALGPNGEDYFVAIDYQSDKGDVFFVDIDACPSVPASASDAPLCPRTTLFPTYANGSSAALHVSGKGFSKPGWAVISTYATKASRDGSWPWYTNKIFAVELKANPRVYPIAYTRAAGGGYWAEPHASVSRDFSRVIFNSNWGKSGEDIDSYIVHLPASALPGGTTPTPPPAPPAISTGGNLPASSLAQAGNSGAPAQGSGLAATPVPATGTAVAPLPLVVTPPSRDDAHEARTTRHSISIRPPALRFLQRSLAGLEREDAGETASQASVRRSSYLAPLLMLPGVGWSAHLGWNSWPLLRPLLERARDGD